MILKSCFPSRGLCCKRIPLRRGRCGDPCSELLNFANLEAADELTIDPADRIAVRPFDEGPGLAARVFAITLDDDNPAVLDRADDVHVNIAYIERRARRVGHTAAARRGTPPERRER
jgi:hypothetical protein